MAIAVAQERQDVLTYRISRMTHVAGHTASPGGTGANEFSGTGAARGAISWGSVTDNGTTATVTGTFAGLAQPNAGATLSYFGVWSAATGGLFRDQVNIDDVTLAGPGTSTGSITITQS